MTTPDPLPEEKTELSDQIPLVWRIVAVVVALGIIGVLLYPRFTNPSNRTNDLTAQTDKIPAQNQASADALFEQGQTHFKAGRWSDAIITYQQVVELDPKYQSAYVNLGNAYLRQAVEGGTINQASLDKAIDAFNEAVDLDPNDADVAYNLGAAYLQQATMSGTLNQAGIEKATAQIERAIDLNPQLAPPHYALAEAYRLQEQHEQAIQSFEKFLELDDGSDPTATTIAQQRLQQLKSSSGQ